MTLELALNPHRESDKDRDAEKCFAEFFLKWKGVKLEKLGDVKYIIDFAAVQDNEVIGFIEYRRRYIDSDKYPTVFCSVTKWMKLIEYRKFRYSAFFVEWDDCIKYISPKDNGYSISWSGRTDRGAWQDMEPNVEILISDMKTVDYETNIQ